MFALCCKHGRISIDKTNQKYLGFVLGFSLQSEQITFSDSIGNFFDLGMGNLCQN